MGMVCGTVELPNVVLKQFNLDNAEHTFHISYLYAAKGSKIEYYTGNDLSGEMGTFLPGSSPIVHHKLAGEAANDVIKSMYVIGESYDGSLSCEEEDLVEVPVKDEAIGGVEESEEKSEEEVAEDEADADEPVAQEDPLNGDKGNNSSAAAPSDDAAEDADEPAAPADGDAAAELLAAKASILAAKKEIAKLQAAAAGSK